jgi:hypothetical protein
MASHSARADQLPAKAHSTPSPTVAPKLLLLLVLVKEAGTLLTPDAIARDLRMVADHLYPPIKTDAGAPTVTTYVKGRRVTVKTATRQNFKIHVGK